MSQTGSNIDVVKHLHQAESYSRALLSLNVLAPDVEWWAAGSPEALPWAGTFQGPAGVREFFDRLNAVMDYRSFEAREYLVAGDQVITILWANGVAKPTGKPFESEIVRIYTFRGNQISKVRNYYDTAAYESSLRGE